MLTYLRIRGLALLEDVSVELAPGLNVLTGETGAGKSIIVGALSLLRGARARGEQVREGREAAEIDAQFEPTEPSRTRLVEVFARHGLSDASMADEGVVVHRSLSRAGRGRTTLQSTLVTQAVLAEIGEELIDICSQHEHHFLTHTARHLEVLDAYAGNEGELAEYRKRYLAWRGVLDELASLRERAAAREQRVDYLRFQIDEIEAARPERGEYEQLRRRVALLRDARRWAEFARDAHAALYEADDAIAGRISALLDRVRGGQGDSTQLDLIEEQLGVARVACEEAARAASRFSEELQIDPVDVEAAEDRLHELDRLRRKHGVDVDELADRLARMRAELEQLEHADEHLLTLGRRCAELEGDCRASAARLHGARAGAGKGLARALEAELAALHMPRARLSVEITGPDELGPSGADHVEFLFSANPGEPLAPLRRVASGGELSRVLLALKGVLAAQDRVATYVFDEVDAGVGGAVAEAIGRRLHHAAAQHQVLCVTHLPQIAAFADAHFRVDKIQRGGRTLTEVVRLTEAERTDELARMLGGAAVGASAREHAAALLRQASARPDDAKAMRRGPRTAKVTPRKRA